MGTCHNKGGRTYVTKDRGGSKGGSTKEDHTQFQEALTRATRAGAGRLEYTDYAGNLRTVETGNKGGAMRISYNQKVADYTKMSEAQLESKLRKAQDKELEGYWGFTRRAASRSGSALQTQMNATTEINAIRQALRRKRQRNK